jgi:NDP-sugar pyrophosphorylase family protein
MIGPNVSLITAEHPVAPSQRRSYLLGKPITIGRGVWIAAGATIIGGVTIGENSVVAAGSVVTRDIPPATLAAGNPARIIRSIAGDEPQTQRLAEIEKTWRSSGWTMLASSSKTSGAIDFFCELGLEFEGRATIDGEWAGRVTGLGVSASKKIRHDAHAGRKQPGRALPLAHATVVADHRDAPVNALGYLPDHVRRR